MRDLAALHEQALASTRRFVANVGNDQWANATPCADWDLRTLVNHIVSGNLWAGELMNGRTIAEVGDRLDGDLLGDDPLAAYDASAKIAADAFAGADAMTRPAAVSYGPVPGRVYVGHRIVDVTVHGWDVAEAIGDDARLPADLVDGCLEIVLPEADQLRASGLFAPLVPVPADADPQTRLLALLGRRADAKGDLP